MQELLTRHRLEVAPELVGPAEQRHVARILVVGEPDDPGDPVRRPALVGHPESLDAQNAQARARQVVQRGAAEPADPDDDRVETQLRGLVPSIQMITRVNLPSEPTSKKLQLCIFVVPSRLRSTTCSVDTFEPIGSTTMFVIS